MKNVLIQDLKGGEILARGVYDDNGVELLTCGTTYKQSYQSKLSNLNIKEVYIHNNQSSNLDLLYTETKILIESQLQRFEKIGNLQIEKFDKLVVKITNHILDCSKTLKSLYNIKHFDDYTYKHSVNVTIIAIILCSEIGVNHNKIQEIARGCILHDLGKTNINEEILNSPYSLTKEEFTIIKKHTIYGYNKVKNNNDLSDNTKIIILAHHEKLDGSGYPLGLSGHEISFGTRVCAIADVFDAMCSNRPYKSAIPIAEAIRIIKTNLNKQLDMEIFSYLENILEYK